MTYKVHPSECILSHEMKMPSFTWTRACSANAATLDFHAHTVSFEGPLSK